MIKRVSYLVLPLVILPDVIDYSPNEKPTAEVGITLRPIRLMWLALIGRQRQVSANGNTARESREQSGSYLKCFTSVHHLHLNVSVVQYHNNIHTSASSSTASGLAPNMFESLQRCCVCVLIIYTLTPAVVETKGEVINHESHLCSIRLV